ncbi:hypothetical protein [Roseimaritima sediminicola]|uniref:hypothetical protein n=1 Tax=Roseimaritima sediminicola TaxID=2662066 RepID=UPI001298496C|nr:hypothetical protein [Roseimaritima sediminicola]
MQGSVRRSLISSRFALHAAMMIALCCLAAGCTPRVVVRANPDQSDTGIRFYRPKPYLKIEPAEVAVDRNQTTLVPGMVRISLVYMPDFSEEYSIDVRTGCGTANVGIKLEDGWNLTEISQDLDSQTDENIEAVGALVKAVGGVVPTAAGDGAQDVSFTVPARNVPIGFYESVVGRDARGCKRLYGFRYVGFLPYAGCPVDMGGHQQACCGDGLHPLYGLMFENQTMVFQPLDVMATTPIGAATDPQSDMPQQTDAPQPPAIVGPADAPTASESELLAVELRSHLRQRFAEVHEVQVAGRAGVVEVMVRVGTGADIEAIEMAASVWLDQRFGVDAPTQLRLRVGP